MQVNVAFQCFWPATANALQGPAPAENNGTWGAQCTANSQCSSTACCGSRNLTLNGVSNYQNNLQYCVATADSSNATSTSTGNVYWSTNAAAATTLTGLTAAQTISQVTCIATPVTSSGSTNTTTSGAQFMMVPLAVLVALMSVLFF